MLSSWESKAVAAFQISGGSLLKNHGPGLLNHYVLIIDDRLGERTQSVNPFQDVFSGELGHNLVSIKEFV